MAVTMADIQHLRKMSGAGMMDCKKALEEANNDYDKAMEIIRKKGQAVAAKRSDREAAEGCVLAADNGEFAAVVAVKCETDFVAKNADFVALTKDILNLAMDKKPASKEELLAAPLADGRSVQEHITDRSGITGEKMELGTYEFVNGASTISYIHPGNKLATVVAFNQAEVEHQMARDVAMQRQSARSWQAGKLVRPYRTRCFAEVFQREYFVAAGIYQGCKDEHRTIFALCE